MPRTSIDKLGPGSITGTEPRQYVKNQVNLRLLSLIGDRPEAALANRSPGIDNAEKEFLQKMI